MSEFSSILIANRGEIAVRVIRSARALGYRTVAVFSEADRGAPHALLADQAVCIGPAEVRASYLDIPSVLEAARRAHAQAVHPGYGFLSENADFAAGCADAGMTFIGPSPEAIRLMGNKAAAKQRMLDAGVPCVPGYAGAAQDDDTFAREAERIGFPVMIKAAAGGGGRGMRLAPNRAALASGLRAARSEARNAFGSDELILERAVAAPRHVEIQVFADTRGETVYLGERDCSIQRRHQKVIEEAPSPALNETLRRRMGEAACRAARAIGYVGAGTVEFLLDSDGETFYFLEMNTRLQVEHPVTEMVTGQDLVAWQIAIAVGKPLPLDQAGVTLQGHAIEARLYAEDPCRDFLPQSGRVDLWEPASGDGVRIDHAMRTGIEVSRFYDPMLAKVVAWGHDREAARRRLRRALMDTVVLGPQTNRLFLLDCLGHPAFAAGDATTAFIGEHFPATTLTPRAPEPELWALAAAILYRVDSRAPQPALRDWSSTGPLSRSMHLVCGEHPAALRIRPQGADGYRVTIGEREIRVELETVAGSLVRFSLDGVGAVARWVLVDGSLRLAADAGEGSFREVAQGKAAGVGPGTRDGAVRAPMNGSVVAIHVDAGTRVSRGQPLVALEAMKIEHELTAPVNGIVQAVNVNRGDQVATRTVLIEIAADVGEPGER